MNIWKALVNTAKNFMKDDPMTYAASLAFYTVVSLPAILLIAINVMSAAYDEDAIKSDLLTQLNVYLGPNTVNQAETILENASLSYSGAIPQIFGWIVLLVSSTTVFISLQNGINRVWGVKPHPDAGFFSLIWDRLASFAMLVSIGFVLLVSLVIDSMLAVFEGWIENSLGVGEVIFIWIGNVILSVFVTTAVFALVFKILPDVKTRWKNVWLGGLFTSILFLLGKLLIGIYLNSTDVGSAYGASGSLVVFLFWVYYSSILVLLGAKFTYEYSLLEQDKLRTTDNAVFVSEEVIAEDVILTDDI